MVGNEFVGYVVIINSGIINCGITHVISVSVLLWDLAAISAIRLS